MKTAIYPGSFDPITLGHLNILRRASGIFDRVVVCIMPNAGKLHPMFTREERVALARRVVSRFPNVEVDTFDGLLAEYAKTFPEPSWSQEEGHWAEATAAGIVDGTSPERPMKRDEVIAVLGRKGLL